MNLLKKDKIHYSGFKIRFAKLYDWIDNIEPSQNEVEYVEGEVCPFFTKNLSNIAKELGIEFEKDLPTSYVDGQYGNYIGFPPFHHKNGCEVIGRIRINPCMASFNNGGSRHYSKIWCIAESKGKISADGKDVSQLLKSTRDFCDKVSRTVGEYYLSFFSKALDVEEYWTSIESVVISDSDSRKKGIESLFIVDDKKRFLELYNKSSAPKRSLSDIAEWLYSKEIEDPLTFITGQGDMDVEWRVIQDPDVDVLYAQKNTDDYLHLIGVGISKTKKEDILEIDKAFLPQVATLITVL